MDDENEKIIGGPGGAPSPATLGLAPSGPAVDREPENVDEDEEPWPSHATKNPTGAVAGNGVAVKFRRWALAVEGVVETIRHSMHPIEHPFTRTEMGFSRGDTKAIDVSNTDCQVGYLVDDKGNVTPAGRFLGDRLPKGQPAGHDLDVNPPLTTAEAAIQFSTTGSRAPNSTAEDRIEANSEKVGLADEESDPGTMPAKTPIAEPPVTPGQNPPASPASPPPPPPPPSADEQKDS